MPNVSGGLQPEMYFASHPALALGQGKNKGVLIELTSDGIQGQIDRSKPTSGTMNAQGEYEFISKYNNENAIKQNILSVTIQKGAQFRPFDMMMVKKTLKGWVKTDNPDGSVTYKPT
ncbi:hypothetical protein IMZ68_00195 [Candidatus Bathyarchaeota archaeon]|nr:hypothetical protein [Candidatus Bathyarchaeota archaeon]